MQIDLDPTERLEFASMAYSRWSDAFIALKAAKAATWESTGKTCPKGDWPLFHDANIKHAQKELDLATKLKDAICKYSPLIIGE